MTFIESLRRDYLAQPHEVSIETLALCNARCTFCPYPTLERQGTRLDDAVLDRLIGEMADFERPFYFSPFKVNEPFLDRRLMPLCRTFNARVPQGALRLFTNGSALTERHIDEVAALSRVAHLWVSLNTHRPREYGELMGLDFEQTARRLDALHAREFPHPVVVSRVGTEADFARYVAWRWPKFSIAMMKRDAWIDHTQPDAPEVPDTPCARWFELSITATGAAALCCMDHGRYGFGSVHDSTLLGIYNHPTLRAWREGLVSRRTAGDPCARCSY